MPAAFRGFDLLLLMTFTSIDLVMLAAESGILGTAVEHGGGNAPHVRSQI